MAPILHAILPTIHFQKSMPRVLVYGPNRYTGNGLNNPKAAQLILHLHCILYHCACPTPTGSFNLTLELGLGTSFWDLDYEQWKYIATQSWVTLT
jgi:hypothetical protein